MSTPVAMVVGFFFGVGVTLFISAIVLFWKGGSEIHGFDDRREKGNRW